MTWFSVNWPWALPMLLALTYELVAVLTQVVKAERRLKTISEIVWDGVDAWSPLQRFWAFVGFVLFAVLLAGHFFYDWWRY